MQNMNGYCGGKFQQEIGALLICICFFGPTDIFEVAKTVLHLVLEKLKCVYLSNSKCWWRICSSLLILEEQIFWG